MSRSPSATRKPVPWMFGSKRTMGKKAVHAVGGGSLIACLDADIRSDDVESLALGIANWHKYLAPMVESTVVFVDNAFENDVAKINLVETLKQSGIGNVRSL